MWSTSESVVIVSLLAGNALAMLGMLYADTEAVGMLTDLAVSCLSAIN